MGKYVVMRIIEGVLYIWDRGKMGGELRGLDLYNGNILIVVIKISP